MSSKDESTSSKPWRDLGQALGGFARRVGQMVDDLQESARLPEDLRARLGAIAGASQVENFEACLREFSDAGEPASWPLPLVGSAILLRLLARRIDHKLPRDFVESLEARKDRELDDRPEAALWRAQPAA